jgi:hypothetical protein
MTLPTEPEPLKEDENITSTAAGSTSRSVVGVTIMVKKRNKKYEEDEDIALPIEPEPYKEEDDMT